MNDDLRTLLRTGDPLPPGEELSPAVARRMRRAVLAEAPPPTPWRRWQMAAVAAGLTSVIAGAYLLVSGPRPDSAGQHGVATVPAGSGATPQPGLTEEPRDRQIRFMTRGGTRVIWMLKPKLAPYTTTQENP